MADEIPTPDDYQGCGPYYVQTVVPNPDFVEWQLYGNEWGLDAQTPTMEITEGPFEGPPCGAPVGYPFPTSFVYNFAISSLSLIRNE